jgi:hypothetical protein
MMDPDRFFIQVHQGVAVLEGRAERRSILPLLIRAVHGVGVWSGSRTDWPMTSMTATPNGCWSPPGCIPDRENARSCVSTSFPTLAGSTGRR